MNKLHPTSESGAQISPLLSAAHHGSCEAPLQQKVSSEGQLIEGRTQARRGTKKLCQGIFCRTIPDILL